jgi:predicted transcriptional regulator of viral defense system
MGQQRVQPSSRELWELVRRQHGVISSQQLRFLGHSRDAILHRVESGRLHPVARGVYAVGRPDLSRAGIWTAAILSCGADAVLSHRSAAALWRIHGDEGGAVAVTVPLQVRRRRPGVKLYRTDLDPRDVTRSQGIPTTTSHRTLLDLARILPRSKLEAAINAADKHDLVNPESLRSKLDDYAGLKGVAVLRGVLDRRTFALTDSELERRFLPIAEQAGLPLPLTGQHVNGFKVDFYWPDLGLVVETDGLRYHRTAAQQTRDRQRDQAHASAGLTPLRFTHAQVRYEPRYVRATLATVARRLRRA